ncbi:hypothetical protein [Serratia proteamaculans]|uniref:MASE1 domain-containing protein n=1 Tax=Serratia proteamaculans TaxID=28151 RepID=A0A5Q2VD02_SERPR|nr:hypothetical protein [Serratia proteamaculans]QGH61976.1 hypothetical protein GHV41_14585 [Serratia proteamaculans]
MIFIPIYFSLALLSLQIRDVWSLSSLVWFPGGLLQGILLVLVPRHWLLWLVSALILHLTASQLYGRPVSVSLIFSLLDSLVMMTTALIWQCFYGAMRAPRRIRQIVGLISLCALSGIAERFITKWALYSMDYPIDRMISLSNIIGYILSYLPLTFFVIYLVTLSDGRRLNLKLTVFCAIAFAIMVLLFTGTRSPDDPVDWQNLALWLSFCLPMLLALSGDLFILSAILSLCAVGSVGGTLYGVGPFANLHTNLQQNVLMAAWYSSVLALPALLCCSYSSAVIERSQQCKMRFLLLKKALVEEKVSYFQVDENERLAWRKGHRWHSSIQPPVSWPQLLAWFHWDDRPAVDALKKAVSSSPQSLKVRIANGIGGMGPATIALSLSEGDTGSRFTGVILEAAGNTCQGEG